jgi:hypothetical protein
MTTIVGSEHRPIRYLKQAHRPARRFFFIDVSRDETGEKIVSMGGAR